MKEKKHSQTDSHLDAPSEANREKHINFPEVEEESSGNFAIDKTTSNRQKQWQQEIKKGEEERRHSNQQNNSTIPMDEDDTLGVP
jgi:hypothetical protein